MPVYKMSLYLLWSKASTLRTDVHNSIYISLTIQERLQNFFIWGPLKILGWHTENRLSSFVMLLANIGYLKKYGKKKRGKRIICLVNFQLLKLSVASGPPDPSWCAPVTIKKTNKIISLVHMTSISDLLLTRCTRT